MKKILKLKKKYRTRTNFKKYKRIKRYKKSKLDKKKLYKLLFIIFLLFINIYIYYFISKNIFINSEEGNESNYDWRKNVQKFIDKQVSILKGQFCREFQSELNKCKSYFNLRDYDEKGNITYKNQIKEELIQIYSNRFRKDFSYIKNIVINQPFSFGNQIAAINNIIYYCEIIGIKNIYFNSDKEFYLKNDIITDKIHIWSIPKDKYNCNAEDTFCCNTVELFYYPKEFRPKRMSLILKDEIKRNLPKLNINKNDLYIYIRAGDLFSPNIYNGYIPYPYCFYEKVITNFKFNDIYIISVDDKNPVIGKLLSNFPKIKHQKNDVKLDIAILMNAYNLANSMSSFTQAAISFNDNLENLFDYEAYKASETILHFHYDVDKLNRRFNVYRMDPTENYLRNIFNWCNREEQRKMLLEEICLNDFIKTKY